VLGLVAAWRPAVTGFELHAQEITDLAKHAIPNLADQYTVRVGDAEGRSECHRPFHLEAGSRQRDIFEIRHTPSNPPGLVFPLHVYEIRAKQSGFYTLIQHIQECNRRRTAF
jgi:hypothetical protein